MLRVADQLLYRIGLGRSTSPAIVLGNQVPTEAETNTLRCVETLLLRFRLIRRLGTPQRQRPGGWQPLELSEQGYRFVRQRHSIRYLLTPVEELYYRYRRVAEHLREEGGVMLRRELADKLRASGGAARAALIEDYVKLGLLWWWDVSHWPDGAAQPKTLTFLRISERGRRLLLDEYVEGLREFGQLVGRYRAGERFHAAAELAQENLRHFFGGWRRGRRDRWRPSLAEVYYQHEARLKYYWTWEGAPYPGFFLWRERQFLLWWVYRRVLQPLGAAATVVLLVWLYLDWG